MNFFILKSMRFNLSSLEHVDVKVSNDTKTQELYDEVSEILELEDFTLYIEDTQCRLDPEHALRKYVGLDNNCEVNLQVQTRPIEVEFDSDELAILNYDSELESENVSDCDSELSISGSACSSNGFTLTRDTTFIDKVDHEINPKVNSKVNTHECPKVNTYECSKYKLYFILGCLGIISITQVILTVNSFRSG